MIEVIFSAIANFILNLISQMGYAGVFILMALESCNIPIPSEIIMPFSGFLVSQGRFNLYWLALIGSLGNLVGSLVSYGIAFKLGNKVKEFFLKSKFFATDYLKAEILKFKCVRSALIPRVLQLFEPSFHFRLAFLKFHWANFPFILFSAL